MNVSKAAVSTAPACCALPASPERHHHSFMNSPSKRRAARQRVLSDLLTKEMVQKAFVKSPVKLKSPRLKLSRAFTKNSSSPSSKRCILQETRGGGALLYHSSFTTIDTALTSKAATAVSSSHQQQQQQQCGCFVTSTDAGLGWTAPRTTSPRRRTIRGVATPRSVRVPATMGATARALRLEMSKQLQIPALDGNTAVAGRPTSASEATNIPTFKNKATPLHKDQMTQETMAEIEDHRNYFRSLRPKRRQIKFNPQLNDGNDCIDPATTASCHVESLSVQDLNIPSPNKRPTSALDDHLQAGANANDMENNHNCPSMATASLCSQSVCSIRSAYEEKRIMAHEQKKNKARIQKLEIDIDNNNAKADYLDELLQQDRAREEQLEKESLELRRRIVEDINVGATKVCWLGMSHQAMLTEEQRLQEQMRALDEEIALLQDWQAEEHVMASNCSGSSGRVGETNSATATGESVSSRHSGILVDACLLLSPAPTTPVATASAVGDIVNKAQDIAVTIEEPSPPCTSPNTTPNTSPVNKSKKKEGMKKKKHNSEKENPGGNGNNASSPTTHPDTTPQRTVSSQKNIKKKKKAPANVRPSLASHITKTDGSTDCGSHSSSSSTTSSGTRASRVWLDMKLSSPRLVVRAKRQAPCSI